jgi:hypothetical protein
MHGYPNGFIRKPRIILTRRGLGAHQATTIALVRQENSVMNI